MIATPVTLIALLLAHGCNGIAGNAEDEPVLDMQYTLNWRTCEYWIPHVAYYIWANSVLG